mmetsp:Transcript_99098/g.289120  ORF Transcript_99098/g.289120 Transcript_99098/m.289120 type:complete len:211 (-) Transcript_99098:1965-2597(-)
MQHAGATNSTINCDETSTEYVRGAVDARGLLGRPWCARVLCHRGPFVAERCAPQEITQSSLWSSQWPWRRRSVREEPGRGGESEALRNLAASTLPARALLGWRSWDRPPALGFCRPARQPFSSPGAMLVRSPRTGLLGAMSSITPAQLSSLSVAAGLASATTTATSAVVSSALFAGTSPPSIPQGMEWASSVLSSLTLAIARSTSAAATL